MTGLAWAERNVTILYGMQVKLKILCGKLTVSQAFHELSLNMGQTVNLDSLDARILEIFKAEQF